MPFERKIVGHRTCPRCNSVADIRVDEHQEEVVKGVILLSLECPKCKLKRSAGMTTKLILGLEELERDILEMMQRPHSQQVNRRLKGKLREVRNKLERARLGI